MSRTLQPELTLASVCGPETAVYDYGGRGLPIVLVHDGGRSAQDWEQVAQQLAAEYRVVTFDLRGHGLSAPMGLFWSFDDAVEQVQIIVGSLDLRWPAVVGHGLGGLVATLYAARTPSCPAAMNIDGVGLVLPQRVPYWQAADPGLTGVASSGGSAAREAIAVRALIDSLRPRPEVLDPIGWAVQEFDVFQVMASARCPLEFVAATYPHDPRRRLWRELVRQQVRRIAERRPGLTLSTIDSGASAPTEQPQQLAERIRKLTSHVDPHDP